MKIVFVTGEGIGHHTWGPLVTEVRKRGHIAVITSDRNEIGDFGFYCDDKSVPGNQKCCIVTINGLDQDHSIRPNYKKFFHQHNWGLFDLGLLPGQRWMNGWLSFKHSTATSPRLGVIEVGWPKSDPIFLNGDPAGNRRDILKPEVVLYAPQTEQDGKQTQVIDAVNELGLRLLIKHWETHEYAQIYPKLLDKKYFANLRSENENAKKYTNITILDPASNFIDALSDADILITDQSSVIYEAALVGVPAVSVRGWKHACGNCKGPQPSPDLSAVAEPGQLAGLLRDLVGNYQKYSVRAVQLRKQNFNNLGCASRKIIDIIEKIAFGRDPCEVVRKRRRSMIGKKAYIYFLFLRKELGKVLPIPLRRFIRKSLNRLRF